jgi:hypothetical protein
MKKLFILTPPDGDSDAGQVGDSEFFFVDNLGNPALTFSEAIFSEVHETEHQYGDEVDEDDDDEDDEAVADDVMEHYYARVIAFIEQHGYKAEKFTFDDIIIRDLY